GGEERGEAGNQSPQAGPKPNVEKTFHYDLARQGTGQGRVLTGSEQSDGEECARTAHAEQWRKKLVCFLDFGDVVAAVRVKRRRGNNQDCGVDKKCEHERKR